MNEIEKNYRREIVDRIIPYAKKDDKLILLVCDMGFGVADRFKEELPDRIFNMGMMEQGTVGIAAGMAMTGLIPVVYSIVNFLVFRAMEQIRNDVVMQNLNVKFIGTGANNYFRFLGDNLNVCGDGGAVTTKSERIYEMIRLLRNHGLKSRDEIEFFGFNSRMDTIQAAVANSVMEHLDEVTARRIWNASLYDKGFAWLDEWLRVPPRRPDVRQVFHTYIVMVKRREELIDFLLRKGVETKIHYPIPIHLQKPCREMGYREGDFPVCERQAKEILTLPVHQYLTEEQIGYVVGQIKEFYGA